MKMCKIIFAEYELPSKIVPEMGTELISEKLRGSSRGLAITI